MVKVCIDATPLLLRSAGVKTYIYHWVQYLIQSSKGNLVSVFPFLHQFGECVHDRSVLGRLPTLARLAVLHAANIRGNPILDWLGRRFDLFHASHQLLNPPRHARLTATIYDMTCWLMPEAHSSANVAAAKAFAERVLKHADALIAISENSRLDAVRILSIPEERIRVIYPGVDESYFDCPPETGRAVARKYGLYHAYVLSVGTVEPRKNVGALLDAYQQLPRSTRDEFDLVVVGSPGWGKSGVLKRLQSGDPGVRYLGYVPEQDLPGLTREAAAFVYPSLYEGFGLPVAQAMAAGVPVVTSNVSSLPEVTGDAALLVDPHSVKEIHAALDRLLGSATLRASLGNKAAERARGYKWETCARDSWQLFERLCGS